MASLAMSEPPSGPTYYPNPYFGQALYSSFTDGVGAAGFQQHGGDLEKMASHADMGGYSGLGRGNPNMEEDGHMMLDASAEGDASRAATFRGRGVGATPYLEVPSTMLDDYAELTLGYAEAERGNALAGAPHKPFDVEAETLAALSHLTSIVRAAAEVCPDLLQPAPGESMNGLLGARQHLIAWLQKNQGQQQRTTNTPTTAFASLSTNLSTDLPIAGIGIPFWTPTTATSPPLSSSTTSVTQDFGLFSPRDQPWPQSGHRESSQPSSLSSSASSSSDPFSASGRSQTAFNFSRSGTPQQPAATTAPNTGFPSDSLDDYGSFDTNTLQPATKRPRLASNNTRGLLQQAANAPPYYASTAPNATWAAPQQTPHATPAHNAPSQASKWATGTNSFAAFTPFKHSPADMKQQTPGFQAMPPPALNRPQPVHAAGYTPNMPSAAKTPQKPAQMAQPHLQQQPQFVMQAIPHPSFDSTAVPKTKRPAPSSVPSNSYRPNQGKSAAAPPVTDVTSSTYNKPQTLAHVPSSMLDSFDWRKPVRTSRKKSKIATTAPTAPIRLTDFEMMAVLGTGTFGKVHLCLHGPSRQYYCMKVLKKQTVYRFKQMDHIENEKQLLLSLRTAGIVQLFATFNTTDTLQLLMEYVPGGELFYYIRKFGRLPEDVARFYAAELVITLQYLHDRSVVYRDLKPENILLDASGHLKLADFGFAKRVVDKTWTMCGTPDYLAPEIITGRGHDTAVDWWSLGVLIFEMVAGYPPFTDKDMGILFRKIQEPDKLIVPLDFSQEANDLVRRLLVVDPSRRLGNIHPDISDIRSHPWFRPIDWDQLARRLQQGPILPILQNPSEITSFNEPNEHPEQPSPPPLNIPEDVQRIFDRF